MDNPVSMSLHPEELGSDEFQLFADDIDYIEAYYTPEFPEDYSSVKAVENYAEDYDIDVITNHGTRVPEIGEESGLPSMRAHVNNLLLGYDQNGDRTVPLQEDVQVINYHAPYEADSESEIPEMRDTTLRNVAKISEELEELGRDVDLTLENSAATNNILSTPREVGLFRDAAQDIGYDDLTFTCDLGHASDPIEMINTMGSRIRNVHIHDVEDEEDPSIDYLMALFPKYNDDDQLMDVQERPGKYTHLPVGRGELPVKTALNELNAFNYEGPITVELNSRFKNKRGWTESRDIIEKMLKDVEGQSKSFS